MTAKDILSALGKVDGGIAALAAAGSAVHLFPAPQALAVAGIAGGLGVVLNGVAALLGLPPVAPTEPPPPPS